MKLIYIIGQHSTASNNDMDGAADQAAAHAGSSGSKDLFSTVLGAITEKQGHLEKEDIDEQGELLDLFQHHLQCPLVKLLRTNVIFFSFL